MWDPSNTIPIFNSTVTLTFCSGFCGSNCVITRLLLFLCGSWLFGFNFNDRLCCCASIRPAVAPSSIVPLVARVLASSEVSWIVLPPFVWFAVSPLTIHWSLTIFQARSIDSSRSPVRFSRPIRQKRNESETKRVGAEHYGMRACQDSASSPDWLQS